MQNRAKKIIASLTLTGILFLSACSGETANLTTTAVSGNTQTIEQTTFTATEKKEENLARVIEVPYENDSIATFTFNEKGLLTSSENCPWGGGNVYYKYDGQNRITEIQNTLSDGTIDENCERKVYSYDENGNLKNFTVYTGTKEKLVRFRVIDFEYNSEGQMIKETLSSGKSNKIMDTTDYEYDEKGKLIKSVCDSYGTKTITEYSYNENGDLAKTVETYNTTQYINTYTYSYDENGKPSKRSAVYVTKEHDNSGNIINESSVTEEIVYIRKNGICLEEFADGRAEYEYFDNNRIVVTYWGSKEFPEEINIDAVPEVMGNYKDLPY